MAAIEPGAVAEPAADFTATSENPPDFANVAEAIAWSKENGIIEDAPVEPDAPVTPAAPVTEPAADDFTDVFPAKPSDELGKPPAAATVPAPTEEAPAAADPYAQWGGQAAVEDAVTVANALKTEMGLRAVIAQGLTALGYSPEQVSTFIASKEGQQAVGAAGAAPVAPAATGGDPFANVADDDVLDGATVKGMLSTVLQQITERIDTAQRSAAQPALEAIQQDRQRNAQHAVDSVLQEVLQLPADPTQVTDVQRGQISDIQIAAGQYIQPDNWDPQHIAYAIRRGAADVAARDQARFQAYVARKRAEKAAAPTNTGGAAPGGEAIAEPKSAKEAAAMRKALGLF